MKKKNRAVLDEFAESANKNTNFDEIVASKKMDKKLNEALKEIILCLIFVGMTMTISYQMIDNDALSYRNNLLNLFGAGSVNTKFYEVTDFFT